MTLLKVGVIGVLKASGAVIDYLLDVHAALSQDFFQFAEGQSVFCLLCHDLRGEWVKASHTSTDIFQQC